MNIKMQCCALVLLFLIGCFFRQQKRLHIHTERVFVWIYRVVAVCVCLDILSLAAIQCMDRLPPFLPELACKAYNTSLSMVVMLGLLYAAVDAYPEPVYRVFFRVSMAVTGVAAGFIFLLPIEYVRDGAGRFLYTFGPSIYVTYVSGLAFMAATVAVLIYRRKYINALRLEAASLWLMCWLGSSLIQLLFKDLLIVGFGSSLGVLVLYVKLENPETYFDRQTGMFNSNALAYFLREQFEKGLHFPILVLVLEDFSNFGLDRVEVFYQPIYNTREQRFTCAEALVRIYDADNRLIGPAAFIEVAEKNGMILKLGRIVFEKVCRLIQEERPERFGLRYIEVNPSTVQCADEALADDFLSILESYNLPPHRINLEITESASLPAKETLRRNMERMMDSGIRFSLDDFGTGQSNLNYIMDMPVDIVKFDKQMSQAFFENDKAHFVMNAAISMVHGMELETVSEGIETEEQLHIMENMGVSYIQGYYFSKPLPPDAFLEFLKEKNGVCQSCVSDNSTPVDTGGLNW